MFKTPQSLHVISEQTAQNAFTSLLSTRRKFCGCQKSTEPKSGFHYTASLSLSLSVSVSVSLSVSASFPLSLSLSLSGSVSVSVGVQFLVEDKHSLGIPSSSSEQRRLELCGREDRLRQVEEFLFLLYLPLYTHRPIPLVSAFLLTVEVTCTAHSCHDSCCNIDSR